MLISGFTPLSLIDWDGHPSAVIFLHGCNFRCPWCQNKGLVLSTKKLKGLNKKDVLQHIEGFGNYIDHICITGGEPTINNGLMDFIRKIKYMGYKVKLDTNGTNSNVIAEAVCNVDFIAMDIKAPLTPRKYSKATGIKIDEVHLIKIINSIDIIRDFSDKYGLDYEFRTTVVPGFHTPKDIEQIAKYAIKGAKRYVIQNFHPCDTLIDPHLESIKPFTSAELEAFADAARPYVNEVKCRNI